MGVGIELEVDFIFPAGIYSVVYRENCYDLDEIPANDAFSRLVVATNDNWKSIV
jgi:hypothetical protein